MTEEPKKDLTNKEIRERMDKVYEEYIHSPERKENVDRARRANRLTPEELNRRFTI